VAAWAVNAADIDHPRHPLAQSAPVFSLMSSLHGACLCRKTTRRTEKLQLNADDVWGLSPLRAYLNHLVWPSDRLVAGM
jgi:hypothetical protein